MSKVSHYDLTEDIYLVHYENTHFLILLLTSQFQFEVIFILFEEGHSIDRNGRL